MKVEDLYDLLCASCQYKPRAPNQSVQDYIQTIWSVQKLQDIQLDPSNVGRKSVQQSTEFRRQGNQAYARSDYSSALTFYTKAILYAPNKDSDCLALAYGNRSAVLFQTGKYFECLKDIKSAITHGYPKEKRPNLCDRKVACFEALGDHSRAVATCRDALKNCEKCETLDTIEQKLAALKLKDKQKKFKSEFYAETFPWKPVPQLANATSSAVSTISRAMGLKVNKTKGRHYVASRDIEPGETVLIEKPFVHAPLVAAYLTHCSNCMKRVPIPTPCRYCVLIVYCSEECEVDAWDTFHRVECQLIPYLKPISDHIAGDSGATGGEPTTMFPPELRALLKAGAETVCEMFIKDQGQVDLRRDKSWDPNEPNSFNALLSLLWSEKDKNESPQSALMILKLLKQTSFFGELTDELKLASRKNTGKKSQQMIDFEVYMCTTLHLLHLISQVNTSLLSESELVDTPSQARIPLAVNDVPGTCVFIRGNLFNHSCYPNVVKYFHGTTGVFRSTRSVAPGEELVIAYFHQTYELVGLDQRSATLKSMLGFECWCQACAEKWPMKSIARKILCPGCKLYLGENVQNCCHWCKRQLSMLQVQMDLESGPVAVRYQTALAEFGRTGVFSDALLGAAIHYLKKLETTLAPPNDEFIRVINVVESRFICEGNCYDKRCASTASSK